MRSAHLWAVLLLLLGAAVMLERRGDVDTVPSGTPLGKLPTQIGPWTGTEVPLDPAVLDVLGKGIFLNRLYLPASSAQVAEAGGQVDLFIAYFPTQRTGQAIHSPQNCLPGSGWTFDKAGVTELTDVHGARYRVGDYLISDGREREEVLYWYRSHGRSIANDYLAKLYTLADSIRYRRTDAALIRVVAPVAAGEDRLAAHQRAVRFAEQVAPLLPKYIPD